MPPSPQSVVEHSHCPWKKPHTPTPRHLQPEAPTSPCLCIHWPVLDISRKWSQALGGSSWLAPLSFTRPGWLIAGTPPPDPHKVPCNAGVWRRQFFKSWVGSGRLQKGWWLQGIEYQARYLICPPRSWSWRAFWSSRLGRETDSESLRNLSIATKKR